MWTWTGYYVEQNWPATDFYRPTTLVFGDVYKKDVKQPQLIRIVEFSSV